MKLKAINCKNMGAILVHQQKPDVAATDLVAEVHSGFEDAKHIAECVNSANEKRETWPEDVAENRDPTAIQGGVVSKQAEAITANSEGKTRAVTVQRLLGLVEQRDVLQARLDALKSAIHQTRMIGRHRLSEDDCINSGVDFSAYEREERARVAEGKVNATPGSRTHIAAAIRTRGEK